jgi:hypothetical protein
LTNRGAAAQKRFTEQLEDFVCDLRETGCSVRSISEAIDLSPSSVQRLTIQARKRRRSC